MKDFIHRFLLIILLFIAASCAHQQKSIQKKQQVINKKDVTGHVAPNGLAQVYHQIEHNCEHYMGTLVVKESMIVPAHTHPKSDEYLYVIKGKGKLVIDGRQYQVKKGDAIFIPKGILHSYENQSKMTEFVQIYTPKGPEQRFKKWALIK